MNPQDERPDKPETTKRDCLKCGRTFNSTGPWNRCCIPCQKSNERAVAPRCEHLGGLVSRGLDHALQNN